MLAKLRMMNPDEHRPYIQAWRARFRREREELAASEAQARTKVRACAECLVRRFGARQVYLIGSLARPEGFHARSDIDLAVTGLAPDQYFPALEEVWKQAGREVDLIPLEEVSPDRAAHIVEKGILLYERTEVPAPAGRDRP